MSLLPFSADLSNIQEAIFDLHFPVFINRHILQSFKIIGINYVQKQVQKQRGNCFPWSPRVRTQHSYSWNRCCFLSGCIKSEYAVWMRKSFVGKQRTTCGKFQILVRNPRGSATGNNGSLVRRWNYRQATEIQVQNAPFLYFPMICICFRKRRRKRFREKI